MIADYLLPKTGRRNGFQTSPGAPPRSGIGYRPRPESIRRQSTSHVCSASMWASIADGMEEVRVKRLIVALAMLLPATVAVADPTYVISNMSCAKVQAAVQSSGSAILRWQSKRGNPLYGRYVSDRRFCLSGEILTIASVPAADKSCNVKKCVWRVRTFR